jgi:hypothetical protein
VRDVREVAQPACDLRDAVLGGRAPSFGSVYGDVYAVLRGGVGFVESGGDSMNLQEIMPPEALALVMVPGLEPDALWRDIDDSLRVALAAMGAAGPDIMRPGDQGQQALFGLPRGTLSEEQVTRIYALLRTRQLQDAVLERVGSPFADNDMLAEMYDEESSMLRDYFAFPAAAYDQVRRVALREGMLGAALTYAFGGYPAMVIMAPQSRAAVMDAVARECRPVHVIALKMDPQGLMPGDEQAGRPQEGEV